MTDLADRAGSIFHEADRPVPAPDEVAAQVRQPVDRRRPLSVTASGRRIDIATRDGRKLVRKPTAVVNDTWTLYRALGEFKFVGRFFGNAMSRIVLYPGYQLDPGDPPIPVLEAVAHDDIQLPQAIADLCIEQTERLMSGPEGMPGLMRAFGENLAMVGDSYLTLRRATPEDGALTDDDEVAMVYSTTALQEHMEQVSVREVENGDWQPLPDDTLVYRVWRRDAQWPGQADSNLFAVLDRAEELLLWERYLRATARTGANAGLLLLPSELDQNEARKAIAGAAAPAGPQAPAADGWTNLELGLMRSIVDPAETDDSRAAVMPHLVRGKAEFLKEVRHLMLERPIDAQVLERMEFLIKRMSYGADLPPEVLTGVAAANHWTGWQIEDSTYKAHVEPTAAIPAVSLAAVFLRPALVLEGVPAEVARRITFGLDPSALVVRPNRSSDARAAYQDKAISGAAYRRYIDFPEDDAPTDEELMRRYALERGIGNSNLTISLMGPEHTGLVDQEIMPPPGWRIDEEGEPIDGPGNEDEPSGAEGDDGGGESGGAPTPAPPASMRPLALPAVTAAAVQLPGLGEQLAAIETRARDRLIAAASAAMTAALRRAGSRLRAATQGTDDRDRVNGIDPEQVGIVLGAARAAELADPDQLLAGAFEELQGTWDQVVEGAERDAAVLVGRVVDAPVTPPNAREARDRGWAALGALLFALASRRLFTATAEPGLGELDRAVTVPAGPIRDALAVAGGGQALTAPVGPASATPAGGLLDGPRWRLELQRFDIIHAGYTWQTGFPTRPFEPHQRLAGVQFTDWQDDVLANAGTWPATSHYYPGDHAGCQCSTVANLVRQE